MEQALVFGVASGLVFWGLRDQFQTQLGEGPDHQGLNTYRPTVVPNEPIYVPSKDLTNITHRGDMTPQLRRAQQKLINESRLESRHPVLDPLRFHDEGNIGPLQDTTLPDIRMWTRPADLYGL